MTEIGLVLAWCALLAIGLMRAIEYHDNGSMIRIVFAIVVTIAFIRHWRQPE